jgi:ABC-2 type transport system permease protein
VAAAGAQSAAVDRAGRRCRVQRGDGSPGDPDSGAVGSLQRLNQFIPVFIMPFLAGALGPLFYLREVNHGMEELFGAYPVTARQWLVMRVGNFWLALVLACLLAQLGFIAVLAADQPDQALAMLAYSALWLAVLHGPTCLLWASVLAWLACRKANPSFLYLAAGAGWLGYLALATMTDTPLISGSEAVFPQLKQAMLVLDPYAATAMLNPMPEAGLLQSRELNVVLCRLIWLLICFLLLRSIRQLPSHAERGTEKGQAPGLSSTSRSGWLERLGSSHLGMHLQFMVRDRIFLLLVGGWIVLLVPEAYGGTDYAEQLSRVVPDSRDALNRVVWDIVPAAMALLLLYAADRICRMYPATRMQELYAATPHQSARLIAVQLVSLWIVAGFFVVLTGLSVVLAQVLAGSSIQPWEYGVQLGLWLPVFALFGVVFVAVHGLVRTRFVANLVCLLILVLGFTSFAPALGLEHPLWRPLSTPLVEPDHYWGFAGSLKGHVAYLQFWIPVCLVLVLLAVPRFHRTLPFSQIRTATAVLRSPANALAAACLLAAIWQGLAIDRTLRQEGLLQPAQERARLRADYERGYAQWITIPQPEVASIRSQVDFNSLQNRVRLRADIGLINRSSVAIDQVLVGRNQFGDGGTVALQGASVLRHDAALGQTIFKLDRPLQPGEGLELGFQIELHQSGLEPASIPFVLRREFSSLPANAILPVIGFERRMTLRDAEMRKEQGLPELKLLAPSELPVPSAGTLSGDLATLDAIVSTDAGQYAIGQGELVRQWQAGGRSYFHYRSDGAVRSVPFFFALAQRPQEWTIGSFRLETFTSKPLLKDDFNVLAVRDTISWLNRDVAPYPGKTLRLLAVPEIGLSGFALPQTVLISQRLGFQARPEAGAGFSQVYRRAVHETAHQWFGHLLGHGITEERAFLVESLAKYAELVMIEQRYGQAAMRALVDYERQRFREARLDPSQAAIPLIDAEDSEDMYSRATLVFACLRQLTGDEPIIGALKKLAADSRNNNAPARSLDFVRALQAASQPKLRPSIETLLLGRRPALSVLAELNCEARQ